MPKVYVFNKLANFLFKKYWVLSSMFVSLILIFIILTVSNYLDMRQSLMYVLPENPFI
jgi:hypothetical protein